MGPPSAGCGDAPYPHCLQRLGEREREQAGNKQRRKPPILRLPTLLGARNYPAFPCSFYPLSNQMNQPSQHLSISAPSDCILLGTPRHGWALTPAQAKPGNRTSLLGWPSLLLFTERLKMSVGCWRAPLWSLARGPPSAPHCTGHRIPQALRGVYFCTL